MSGGESRLLGRWGEALAAEELRRRGCRLVEAGWRCRFGEVDLIAEEGPFLCFVEVKLRKDGRVAQAREFVDRRKQEKLRTTAQLYLAEHPTQLQPRFDVVEIYAPQGLATRAPGGENRGEGETAPLFCDKRLTGEKRTGIIKHWIE